MLLNFLGTFLGTMCYVILLYTHESVAAVGIVVLTYTPFTALIADDGFPQDYAKALELLFGQGTLVVPNLIAMSVCLRLWRWCGYR